LLAQEKNRDFESASPGPELAKRLTTRIHEMSLALGVPAGAYVADVIYSEMVLPNVPPPPITMTPETREQARNAMLRQNCYFQAIEMLPNDIGYVKLMGFPDATACEETTRKAMQSVNNASAVIIDLRGNRGGFGETALQIAGYFFNRPTFLWDPRPHTIVPAETASPVASNMLADKPVYVLTSSTTASAAEYFVYNLKMLKRATIVGEKTAGQQHSGVFHRVTDHIGMGIQEESPAPNPFDVKGWETIGVEPDLKVSRDEALDTAKKLAESKSAKMK
jgi:C-terminal processing protease CtpA/Prc